LRRILPLAPVHLHKVPEEKVGKNRLHIDLDIDGGDLEAEITRAEQLGARRVQSFMEGDLGWWVMADPEGNLFCVARPLMTTTAEGS
jgi:predicted enzyme related to lactoylglutathione lyase